MAFVHLHGHSQYSLLEGIGEVASIVKQVEKLGMSAVAITDYYALYGALEFYQKAKKSGIQAIIGVDLPFVHDVALKKGDFDHLGFVTILANNRQGYQTLLKLVSMATTVGYYHRPRVDWSMLREYGQDLTVLVGGEQSLIATQLQKSQDYQTIENLIVRMSDVMNSNIIIEYCVQEYETVPLAQHINDIVVRISDTHNYMCTCSNNYHYIKSDEQEPFEIALAIKDQKLYQDRDRRKVVGQYHIMTEDEIRHIMGGHNLSLEKIDMMIENTVVAAGKLKIEMPPLPAMFPSYEPPEGVTELYQKYKDYLIVTREG